MTYYEDLGVDKKASKEQIKRAYKKRASKTHPDKGGSRKDFEKVQRAYEVLSCDQKKDYYDTFGKDNEETTDQLLNELLVSIFDKNAQDHFKKPLAVCQQALQRSNDIIKELADKVDKINKDLEVIKSKNLESKVNYVLQGLKMVKTQLESDLVSLRAQNAIIKDMMFQFELLDKHLLKSEKQQQASMFQQAMGTGSSVTHTFYRM